MLENKLSKEKSEDFYRKVVENLSSLVVKFDLEGHLVYANPAYLRTIGKTREELIGKQFFSLVHDDDLDGIKTSLQKTLSPPYTTEHRERVHTIHGWRWYIWHATGIQNDSGEVNGIISIGHDITEQVEAEHKLKESEVKFRTSFQNSAISMALVDETGQFISINQASCRKFGYTKEQFLKLNFLQITHPDDREKSHQSFSRCLEDRQPYTIEKRYFDRNENTIVGLTSVSPIFDSEGNFLYAVAHLEDITKRKHYEEALLEEKNRVQMYLDIAEVIILALDKDLCVTLANRKCHEVLGYDKDEQIIGKHWIENFISDHDQDRVTAVLNNLLQGKIELAEYTENAILTKDGNEIIIAWHNVILTNQNGEITGILSSGQDITDRRKAEQAIRTLNVELEQRVAQRTAQLREANKELEAFSYSVSHDLQAPIRAIQGFSEIIEVEYGDSLPEDMEEYFDRIKKAAAKMHQLVDGLLGLSRMGRKTLSPVEIEIDPLALKIYEELAALEGERDIKFSANTGKTITGDKEMISILLRNLISNALKYTQLEDKATIKIGCKTIEGIDTFFISDNGIGFDMEYADKLFQPFQRLHVQDEFDGTGIGLSLSKRILKHHSGGIWAYSEKGNGTTFYFTIGHPESPPIEYFQLPPPPD